MHSLQTSFWLEKLVFYNGYTTSQVFLSSKGDVVKFLSGKIWTTSKLYLNSNMYIENEVISSFVVRVTMKRWLVEYLFVLCLRSVHHSKVEFEKKVSDFPTSSNLVYSTYVFIQVFYFVQRSDCAHRVALWIVRFVYQPPYGTNSSFLFDRLSERHYCTH